MVAYRLDINTGDLIDGKYIVINRIGSGSYGDVYKVKDAQNNEYALKLLRLWEVSSELHETLVTKFEQEYKTGKLTSEYLGFRYSKRKPLFIDGVLLFGRFIQLHE